MMLLHGYRYVLIQALSLYFVQLLVESLQPNSCTTPSLENGKVKTKPSGRGVFFRCNKGFQRRLGAKFAFCLPNGLWSKPPPKCIRKGCRAIHYDKDLRVKRKYKGAMLKFTCVAGMQRKGPEFIYCNGKRWNDENPPKCVVDIDLQCNFEDDNLCGWGQADNDQFEWTWFSGGTLSPKTGPQTDHTFGDSDSGHFLYIEASGRKLNDTAILLSPLYQPQYSSLCFEFWYHMYGPTNAVGSLEVFVQPESRILDDIDPEFYMAGNQGPEWKRGSITIEKQTEFFQIVIVGTLKGHFQSDIAVDDFKLYNCSKDDPDDLELNGFPETNTAESVIIPQTKHGDTESGNNPSTESYPGVTEDSEATTALPTMTVDPFSTVAVSSAIPQQAVNSIRTSSDATIVLASHIVSVRTQDIKLSTQYERTGDPAVSEESAPYLSLLISGTTGDPASSIENDWYVRETLRPTMTRHPLPRGFSTSEHLQSQQYSHTNDPDDLELNGFPETNTAESVIIPQTKHGDTESGINPSTESYPGVTEDSEATTALPTMTVDPFSTVTVSSAIPQQAVNSIRTSSDATIVLASQIVSVRTQDIKLSTQYERTGDPAVSEESAPYLSLLISGTTVDSASSIENDWNVRETLRPTMTRHPLPRGFSTSEHLQSQQYSHTNDPDDLELNGFPETNTAESVIIPQTKHGDTESGNNPSTESYPGVTEDSEATTALPTMTVDPFSTVAVSSANPQQAVNSIRTSSDATIVLASQIVSVRTQDIKLSTQYERTGDPAVSEESAPYLSLLISGTTGDPASSIENDWYVRETLRPTMTRHPLPRGFSTSEHLQSQQYSHTSNVLTLSPAITFFASPSLSTITQSITARTQYQRTDDPATIEEESLPLLRITTTNFLTPSIENKVIVSETFQPTWSMETFNTIETSFQFFENAHMIQTVRSVGGDLATDPPDGPTGIDFKATPLSTGTASVIFHIPSSIYANSIHQTVQANNSETDIEPSETIMPTNVLTTNLQPKHSTHGFSSKLAISSSLPERPHQATSYSYLPINNSNGEGSDLHEFEYGPSPTIDHLNTELVNKSKEFYNPEIRETISIVTMSIHFIIIISCCIVLGLIFIAIAAYIWAKREEEGALSYRCANNELQS
ncbi:mucin-6 [Patella vulgata]|uniref:mucin-6 n=1 Tax=Patella vulgata TaxID=6465 RepID=UPI00217F9F9C|nr:mucin-6 [Patella vulgata]